MSSAPNSYPRRASLIAIIFFLAFTLAGTVSAQPSANIETNLTVAQETEKAPEVTGDETAKDQAPDDIFSDEEKTPETLPPETTPLPDVSTEPTEPTDNSIMGLVNQYGLYAGGGLVALILLIVVLRVAFGGKSKAKCEKCGKNVLPGMVLCDNCASPRNMMLDMEEMAPKIPPAAKRTPSPVSASSQPVPQVEPRKKTRPSGRVIATITVRKGENPGYKFSFYESQVQMSIGKDSECDMVLEEDDEVANRHAVISMAEGGIFTIHDMSTAAGVMVNGKEAKQTNLKSGDVIKIGKTELTFARL